MNFVSHFSNSAEPQERGVETPFHSSGQKQPGVKQPGAWDWHQKLGAVLWNWTFHLWDLMLFPVVNIRIILNDRNWIQLGHPASVPYRNDCLVCGENITTDLVSEVIYAVEYRRKSVCYPY